MWSTESANKGFHSFTFFLQNESEVGQGYQGQGQGYHDLMVYR